MNILSYDEFLEYCVTNGYSGDVDSIREAYNAYVDANSEPNMGYEEMLEFCTQNGVQLDAYQLQNLQEKFDINGKIKNVRNKLDGTTPVIHAKGAAAMAKAKGKDAVHAAKMGADYVGTQINGAGKMAKIKGKEAASAVKGFAGNHKKALIGAGIAAGSAATAGALYHHYKKTHPTNEGFTYDEVLEYCAENGVALDSDQLESLKEYFF